MTAITTTNYPTDMVLIQQINAVNAPFVTFNNIPTIYNYILLYLTGVSTLNNSDQLALQISPDNVTWLAGQQGWLTASSTPGFLAAGQNLSYFQLVTTTSGFSTGYKANGIIYFPTPSVNNGVDHQISWEITPSYNVPQINIFQGGGDYATVANHIRLFGYNGSSQTGLYGIFSLYGVIGT